MDLIDLWNAIKGKTSKRKAFSAFAIPPNRVDTFDGSATTASFKKDADYFQVVVNEMYLTRGRSWLDKIDPVVYVLSEFQYNGEAQVVPVLVGPALLKEKGIPGDIAGGIVFRNTLAAGPFPYRGGGLTLAVVLCEARRDNTLKSLLGVVESTSKALGLSPMTGPYTKIASALIDGFGALVNSGGVEPLIGMRDSYGPKFGTSFSPSHFVLIDAPEVPKDQFWVREKQLVRGANLKDAKEFRDADFVLYSISGPDENRRDDDDSLPFRTLWQRIQKEALSPIDDPNYKNARAMFGTLLQEVVLSPDLTEPQAYELVERYQKKMETDHKLATTHGGLSEAKLDDDAAAKRARDARRRGLAMFKS